MYLIKKEWCDRCERQTDHYIQKDGGVAGFVFYNADCCNVFCDSRTKRKLCTTFVWDAIIEMNRRYGTPNR